MVTVQLKEDLKENSSSNSMNLIVIRMYSSAEFCDTRLGLKDKDWREKLLIQIDETGKVKVLEVVSSTHPDFVESSKKAAEGSTYEPPQRNGEPVKVQFYLPVRYSLLDQ
jgi:hypothetical protein